MDAFVHPPPEQLSKILMVTVHHRHRKGRTRDILMVTVHHRHRKGRTRDILMVTVHHRHRKGRTRDTPSCPINYLRNYTNIPVYKQRYFEGQEPLYSSQTPCCFRPYYVTEYSHSGNSKQGFPWKYYFNRIQINSTFLITILNTVSPKINYLHSNLSYRI